MFVGQCQCLAAQAGQFGAEHEHYRTTFQGQRLDFPAVGMGAGCDQPVALLLEPGTDTGQIGLRGAVAVQAEPLGTSQGDFGIDLEGVLVFHEMDVLDAQGITTAQHGAGIMGLIDILKQ